MSSKKHIIKASSAIGLATLTSRVLGFIRDIVIARLFGTGSLADSFVVSFRIPNLLRDLVGEGAMNSSVVPVLTEYLVKKDRKEYWYVVNILLNITVVFLMVITILGIIFAPAIVRVIGFGFTKDPAKLALTIKLTRVMFPFVLLVGLWAYAMAVLNSLRRFFLPALGPAILNIIIILSALLLCPKIGVMGLAIGVLIGGVLQLLIQIPALFKNGMRPGRVFDFNHPAIKTIGKLSIPRIFGSAVYQLNVLVNTMLASMSWIVGAGAVSALYYANRLFQFPQAIFGFSVAQAILPTLSIHAAENNLAKLKEMMSFSLRMTFFIMIPSAVGFMVLNKPIIKILFERGNFTSFSSEITALALFYYSFGLVFYSGSKVLISGFYSLSDTITPAKVALVSLVVNIVLSVTLMFSMKLGGLALSSSVSGGINFLILFALLRKKIGLLGGWIIMRSFIKSLGASLVMALVLILISNNITFSHSKESVFIMAFLIACGVSLFCFSALIIFRMDEMKSALKWISRKN